MSRGHETRQQRATRRARGRERSVPIVPPPLWTGGLLAKVLTYFAPPEKKPIVSKRMQRLLAHLNFRRVVEKHKDGEQHVVVRGRLNPRLFQRSKYARV